MSVTFAYTGAVQTFVVPAGVTSIDVECWGAAGLGSYAGLGGYLKATQAVTPGETLNIYVGGAGYYDGSNHGGWNGGAVGTTPSGGASDVRRGGTALTNRIVVAGGGAGHGGSIRSGGVGGGTIGGSGTASGTGDVAATGGTQSSGGVGGYFSGDRSFDGSTGSLGNGGNGGNGGGGPGGGGGYYGGGGGDGYYGGGGGGGSSFASGTIITNTQGVQSGNGQITITAVSPVVNSGFMSFV